ncbi:hypothetical protein P152DRAFT_372764, partial [Eremomyces bilateralis CBS 781.70]
GDHPVDRLMRHADDEFDVLTGDAMNGHRSPADVYRAQRGRHPPPGFDAWLAFAKKHNALIHERFFDRVYDDLRPFWGVKPAKIRGFAAGFGDALVVRNGTVTIRSDGVDRPWLGPWAEMVQEVAEHLPDLEMAMNVLDESRVIVPWETIAGAVEKEIAGRKSPEQLFESLASYRTEYDLTWPDEMSRGVLSSSAQFVTAGKYWDLAKPGCHPASLARNDPFPNYSGAYPPPTQFLTHLFNDYVSNWTRAKDPCSQPHLRSRHGTFIEPLSISTTTDLVPIFGGSKLSMNNDILLPAAMYYHDVSPGHVYSSSGTEPPWAKKSTKMIWRGVASGGRNRHDTWPHFHRHGFVSMVNATAAHLVETGSSTPAQTFRQLSPTAHLRIQPLREGRLGQWLPAFSDVAFTGLECFPQEPGFGCSYTDPYFALATPLPFAEMLTAKYLPDLDGNSYSARYLEFLRSGSLPIKATLYNEWHDGRLVAWKHFVPMDNTFIDIYSIMEYFIGYGEKPPHDRAARKIATEGKEWAAKVLRKEDMVLYTFRLLLEYARLCDDGREELAYVGDQ